MAKFEGYEEIEFFRPYKINGSFLFWLEKLVAEGKGLVVFAGDFAETAGSKEPLFSGVSACFNCARLEYTAFDWRGTPLDWSKRVYKRGFHMLNDEYHSLRYIMDIIEREYFAIFEGWQNDSN